MSTRQMRKRIEKLTPLTSPADRLIFTGMEEAYRLYWRLDKQAFIELANEPGSWVHSLVAQFEREDAERAAKR